MTLKLFFAILAILSILFGVGFVLAPAGVVGPAIWRRVTVVRRYTLACEGVPGRNGATRSTDGISNRRRGGSYRGGNGHLGRSGYFLTARSRRLA
jgi:hypothetical protein